MPLITVTYSSSRHAPSLKADIAAGITDKVLTMADAAALIDAREQSQIQEWRAAPLASQYGNCHNQTETATGDAFRPA